MESIIRNSPESLFSQALEKHLAGNLAEAEVIYNSILLQQPRNFDVLACLGTIALQRLDAAEGVRLLKASLEIDSSQAYIHNLLASGLKELQQYDEAVASCDQAIALTPDYADAYYNRGIALFCLNRLQEAIASFDRALALKPGFADAYYNCGIAQHKLGLLEEAIVSYDHAILFKPDYVEAFYNRGNVLLALGRHEQAIESYDGAITIKPEYAEALNNRGNALVALQRFDEAIASYDIAIQLNMNYAEAFFNRGNALRHLNRLDQAITNYDCAIVFKPDYVDAYTNRGNVLLSMKRFAEAAASYEQAIALDAGHADTYCNRGNALYELGELEQALADYHKALEIDPDYMSARWAIALSQFSAILEPGQDVQGQRLQVAQKIAELDAWLDASRISKAAATVGDLTLFYLSYQEEDNKPLLAQYGALCNRIMAHWQNQQDYHCCTLAGAGRIKVGIVSNHIKAHSVWYALTKGWVQNLARDKLELHIFYTGKDFDSQTALARAKSTSFVQGELTLTQWTEAILSHQIEVLIFPEIGMDPMTMKLANLRLAPVQIAAWGHPETSGLPTIDYFVSAQGMEPENGQQYYTERLIQLPNLGGYYQSLNVTAQTPDLGKLGINEDGPLLVCPGTPYKYAPQYDWLLVEIAQRLGQCQFIFFTFGLENDLTGKLKQRLQRKFKDSGLDLDEFAKFIPWLDAPEFYGLMQRADVYLDTIGFSGFNTAMQAVQCSLPIVTREGRFMRGRLASGILKQLDLQELVAGNEEDYIALAVRLVQDKAYRQSISQRIDQMSHRLFTDLQPIRAMEDFLMEVCRNGKANSQPVSF